LLGAYLSKFRDPKGAVFFDCIESMDALGHRPCTDVLKRYVSGVGIPIEIATLDRAPRNVVRVMPIAGVLRLLLYSLSESGDRFRDQALPGLIPLAISREATLAAGVSYPAPEFCEVCGIKAPQRALAYFARGEYSPVVLPGQGRGRPANRLSLRGAVRLLCGTATGEFAREVDEILGEVSRSAAFSSTNP
jgi:hypothetical protein